MFFFFFYIFFYNVLFQTSGKKTSKILLSIYFIQFFFYLHLYISITIFTFKGHLKKEFSSLLYFSSTYILHLTILFLSIFRGILQMGLFIYHLPDFYILFLKHGENSFFFLAVDSTF